MLHLGPTLLLWWPVVVTVMLVSGITTSLAALLTPGRRPVGNRVQTRGPVPTVPSQIRRERVHQDA